MTTSTRDSCNACSTITSIPPEILSHIHTYLEPADIISLRKTCKHLFDATSQRSVWTDALQRVCTFSGLFLPSFTMEKMSTQQLEKAAFAPRLFESKVMANNPENFLQPFRVRVLEPRFASEDIGQFRAFKVVPGGRYLVTDCERAIVFWDLAVTPPSPLASLPSKSDAMSTMEFGPTTDGRGVLVFVIEEQDGLYTDLTVYAIYPSSQTPEFTRIASLNHLMIGAFDMTARTSTDTLLVLLYWGMATIWNFKDNRIITLHAPEGACDIAVFEGYLLIFQPDRFSLYVIPPLRQRHEGDRLLASVLDQYHPLAEFAYPSGSPYSKIYLAEASWFPKRNNRQIFGFSATDDRDKTILNYYVGGAAGTPGLRMIPVLASSSNSTRLPERHGPLYMAFCNERIAQIWSTGPRLSIILGSVPTQPGTGNGVAGAFKSAALGQFDRGYLMAYGFSPATGRLCVMTSPHGIRIIDYLPPF
ncbi:hypothetical protein LshimejAT787_1601330 [Lyophyllum shimeji]|uniref:F-box domain-containing protein n=1 Tax=Lyophyllum shimeji TaxID=47721 RepID=A0A9P3PY77_LYOSH|nr:hypothetical protein LshimejAT787_1601330 [Lyophyllum shimeji]